MANVRLEIMPGLRRYFDTEGEGRLVFEREVGDNATIRDLLEEIASENRELGETMFNTKTGYLSDHLSIILNGRFFELSGGMDRKLKPGDTLRLMLAFSGG